MTETAEFGGLSRKEKTEIEARAGFSPGMDRQEARGASAKVNHGGTPNSG